MATTTTAKDRAGSRGRARGATKRNRIKPARASRDTRSRSRANDERKAAIPQPNLKARSPANRRAAQGVAPKNKRDRTS